MGEEGREVQRYGELKELGHARGDEETHLQYLHALVESSEPGDPTGVRAYVSKILICALFLVVLFGII